LIELIEYTGNLHIHSRYSDGAGTVPEIARSAQRSGLDFIILNDHGYMSHDLHLEDEGYYGDVLVLMGLEIGKRYHHYLAYDLKKNVKRDRSGPQDVIDSVNEQGGFGFLAHPFEKGMPFHDKSIAYTWNDLYVKDFTGICIWNFSSRWKERVRSPFHAIFFLLFKSGMLKGPSKKTLSFWDDLCRKQRVVAMGGSDAHGAGFKWGPLNLTPLTYDYTLNSINAHILSERRLPKDCAEAKTEIYRALKEGRLFIAHDNLASGKGFRFHFVSDDGSSLFMGSEKPFQPGTLYMETPLKSEIRLLKNGAVIKKWRERKASYRVKAKGVYRVEVYYYLFPFGWRAWIFSNPIYLR
jgi:PHP domain-containing protein